MANDLLNALRRKLASFEGAGMVEQAKRVKARLADEEKAVAKAEKKAEAKADPEPKTEPSKTTAKKET